MLMVYITNVMSSTQIHILFLIWSFNLPTIFQNALRRYLDIKIYKIDCGSKVYHNKL